MNERREEMDRERAYGSIIAIKCDRSRNRMSSVEMETKFVKMSGLYWWKSNLVSDLNANCLLSDMFHCHAG